MKGPKSHDERGPRGLGQSRMDLHKLQKLAERLATNLSAAENEQGQFILPWQVLKGVEERKGRNTSTRFSLGSSSFIPASSQAILYT